MLLKFNSSISSPTLRIGRLHPRFFSSIEDTARSLFFPRTLDKFRDEHKAFLDLVGKHGEGHFNLTRKNRILELKICNAAKKNAISGQMMSELPDHLLSIGKEIAKDDDLLALVIRGEGDEVFASGADLQLATEVLDTPEKGIMMSHYMTPILNTLKDSPLIVIAYLNGFVVGGGAELSTAGDFRIMADKVATDGKNNFIQFVHAKIGASPGWGGGNRLTGIVGRRHALRLLGSSARISATEGLNIGLVDKIHHNSDKNVKETADDAVLGFLKPYFDQPYPRSVLAMKKIVASAQPSYAISAESTELEVFKSRWRSEDNIKALTIGTASAKKQK